MIADHDGKGHHAVCSCGLLTDHYHPEYFTGILRSVFGEPPNADSKTQDPIASIKRHKATVTTGRITPDNLKAAFLIETVSLLLSCRSLLAGACP